MTPFPGTVTRTDEGWFVRPDGNAPSARLLAWFADGGPPPDGYRWTSGTVPIPVGASDAGAPERPIGVDQTNRSVIVADAVVVKWTAGALAGPQPGPDRLRRLTAAGFDRMPRVVGILEWCTPEGHWVPVASAFEFLAGAVDGWTWCLHEARVDLGVAPGPARPFAVALGRVTAAMHRALATGGARMVAPHGDFHVGQILRNRAGELYVIDFDGNPTLGPVDRVADRPAAYDVAGMLLSLENVGHVLRRYHPQIGDDAVAAWSERNGREFLAGYRPVAGDMLDEAALPRLIEDQIGREFAYARDHLPGWRYVPEAALRRRLERRRR